MPNFDVYVEMLKGVWSRKLLTNQGPLVRDLEKKLRRVLCIENEALCVANGSLGLQMAIKALELEGEVITTPFSYVATTSCPLWECCSVRYADIEDDYLTLDPVKAESLITDKTVAILATHVFGNPCDVEAFERISKEYNIPVIYDAAHAFGVTYKGKSILEWGEASMVSLHATKLFHTVEGGLLYSPKADLLKKMEWMRRFGHDGPEAFHGVGMNAKMSELHAAMGLANLLELELISEKREALCDYYDEKLRGIEHIKFAFKLREHAKWNAAYYPVLFSSEELLLKAVQRLKENEIMARRYFYPSLNTIGTINENLADCPISEDVSKRVLSLPLAVSYSFDEVDDVVRVLRSVVS